MSTIGRMPVQGPQLPALRPAAPESVRQAQRDFFAAATGQSAPKFEAAPVPPETSLAAVEPGRYVRPGSLLDIKV